MKIVCWQCDFLTPVNKERMETAYRAMQPFCEFKPLPGDIALIGYENNKIIGMLLFSPPNESRDKVLMHTILAMQNDPFVCVQLFDEFVAGQSSAPYQIKVSKHSDGKKFSDFLERRNFLCVESNQHYNYYENSI